MRIRWMTVFLDRPTAEFDDTAGFWAAVTGSTQSPSRGAEGEFATLLPASGDAYLRVQRVADDGGCHLDLHLDQGQVDDGAERAVTLGARVLRRSAGLVVLDSPGGFTFCLVRWDGEAAVPQPAELEGSTARLDQLALDIPPDSFESECEFWTALTGWPLRSGSQARFAYLDRAEGMPVRLLLHRRDVAEPGARVTGHPDFACRDVAALAERHVAAGAGLVARFPNWLTLTDPAGFVYCLTRRDPDTGRLPS